MTSNIFCMLCENEMKRNGTNNSLHCPCSEVQDKDYQSYLAFKAYQDSLRADNHIVFDPDHTQALSDALYELRVLRRNINDQPSEFSTKVNNFDFGRLLSVVHTIASHACA